MGTGCSHDNDLVWSSSSSTASPTVSPTVSPTPSPTVSPTWEMPAEDCYFLICGRPGREYECGESYCADVHTENEVTCCSDTAISGWREPYGGPIGDCPVYAERNAGDMSC